MSEYFEGLNRDILYIANKINSNENIRKLLFYNDVDPINGNHSTPLPSNLLKQKIFPSVKTVDVETEISTLLMIYPISDTTGTSNDNYTNDEIVVDIVTHIDSSLINEGIRLLLLASYIDDELNNKRITHNVDNIVTSGTCIDELKRFRFHSIGVNEKFEGYRFRFKKTALDI